MFLLALVSLASVAHALPAPLPHNASCPRLLAGNKLYPCYDRGECLENGECKCVFPYDGPACDYQLKSRRTAFILSFLFGTWGGGQLYLGNVGTGLLQLSVCILLMLAPCVPMWCLCLTRDFAEQRKHHRTVVRVCVVALALMFLWNAVDFVSIVFVELDGRGYAVLNDLGSSS